MRFVVACSGRHTCRTQSSKIPGGSSNGAEVKHRSFVYKANLQTWSGQKSKPKNKVRSYTHWKRTRTADWRVSQKITSNSNLVIVISLLHWYSSDAHLSIVGAYGWGHRSAGAPSLQPCSPVGKKLHCTLFWYISIHTYMNFVRNLTFTNTSGEVVPLFVWCVSGHFVSIMWEGGEAEMFISATHISSQTQKSPKVPLDRGWKKKISFCVPRRPSFHLIHTRTHTTCLCVCMCALWQFPSLSPANPAIHVTQCMHFVCYNDEIIKYLCSKTNQLLISSEQVCVFLFVHVFCLLLFSFLIVLLEPCSMFST